MFLTNKIPFLDVYGDINLVGHVIKSHKARSKWKYIYILLLFYEIAEDCPFLQQEKVAKTSCMSACKHVATSLMNFLMDNNIKQVTMGALQQFNLDLIQCERKSSLFAKFVGQGFSRNSCVKSWHSRNYVEI